VYEVHALAAEITRKVRETWSEGKPVILGEFAYGGEAKPAYDHTHVGLWSATFSGAGVLAHSAPPFNVDSDEFMTPERARHFRVLRDFLRGLPALAPGAAEATNGVSAWSLVETAAGTPPPQQRAALWLLGPKRHYGEAVKSVRVSMRGLEDGAWKVQWIDDVTGDVRSETTTEARSGLLRLDVPPFSRHLAARLTRQADSPRSH
jgi:hypothetical protein